MNFGTKITIFYSTGLDIEKNMWFVKFILQTDTATFTDCFIMKKSYTIEQKLRAVETAEKRKKKCSQKAWRRRFFNWVIFY